MYKVEPPLTNLEKNPDKMEPKLRNSISTSLQNLVNTSKIPLGVLVIERFALPYSANMYLDK